MYDGFKYNLDNFSKILDLLLSDNGCPWDREQTHESLKMSLIEECYEAAGAIDKKDNVNLCEELGDILLQVLFHSKIAEKNGEFTFDDVTDGISKKMINRHKHIFGDANVSSSEEVSDNWEKIKADEKGFETITDSLRGISNALPALLYAQKVLEKASKAENQQSNIRELFVLIKDSILMLERSEDTCFSFKKEILGDIMLYLIKLMIFFEINAETTLTNAAETYINRFGDYENAQI